MGLGFIRPWLIFFPFDEAKNRRWCSFQTCFSVHPFSLQLWISSCMSRKYMPGQHINALCGCVVLSLVIMSRIALRCVLWLLSCVVWCFRSLSCVLLWYVVELPFVVLSCLLSSCAVLYRLECVLRGLVCCCGVAYVVFYYVVLSCVELCCV